jgi:hypothetical protein
MATRPAIFKWRQAEPEFILCAVRWYLRYSRYSQSLEMSKSGWMSAVWEPNIRQSGAGCSATAPKCSNGCGVLMANYKIGLNSGAFLDFDLSFPQ